MAVANHSTGPLREALASRTYKNLYDTHLGHTMRSYLTLRQGWYHDPDDRPVLNLLAQFATMPSIRWAHLPQVTGLSLHGAARRAVGIKAHERVAQSAELLARISAEGWNGRAAQAEASVIAHLWHLSRAFKPSPDDDLGSYLARLRIPVQEASPVSGDDEHAERLALTAHQRHQLRTTFQVLRGRPVPRADLDELIDRLSEPLTGTPMISRSQAATWSSSTS